MTADNTKMTSDPVFLHCPLFPAACQRSDPSERTQRCLPAPFIRHEVLKRHLVHRPLNFTTRAQRRDREGPSENGTTQVPEETNEELSEAGREGPSGGLSARIFFPRLARHNVRPILL